LVLSVGEPVLHKRNRDSASTASASPPAGYRLPFICHWLHVSRRLLCSPYDYQTTWATKCTSDRRRQHCESMLRDKMIGQWEIRLADVETKNRLGRLRPEFAEEQRGQGHPEVKDRWERDDPSSLGEIVDLRPANLRSYGRPLELRTRLP
jgi:hypothetical protein